MSSIDRTVAWAVPNACWVLFTSAIAYVAILGVFRFGTPIVQGLSEDVNHPLGLPSPNWTLPKAGQSIRIVLIAGGAALAGIVTWRKSKWWVGPVLGTGFGLMAAFAMYFLPGRRPESPLLIAPGWVVSGVLGSFAAICRRHLDSLDSSASEINDLPQSDCRSGI